MDLDNLTPSGGLRLPPSPIRPRAAGIALVVFLALWCALTITAFAGAAELTFPYANGFEGMRTSIHEVNPTNRFVEVPNPSRFAGPLPIAPDGVLVIGDWPQNGAHVAKIDVPDGVDAVVEITDAASNPMRVHALEWHDGSAQFLDINTPDKRRAHAFLSSDGAAALVVTWYADATRLYSEDVSLLRNSAIAHAPIGATRAVVSRQVSGGNGVAPAPWTGFVYFDGFRLPVYATEVQ